jgi:hypothetical protein
VVNCEPDPAVRVANTADAEWALQRVTDLCGNAYADAAVYGKKLLKGFGYPNESFRAAQDARALAIVLDRLKAAEAEVSSLRAAGDQARVEGEATRQALQAIRDRECYCHPTDCGCRWALRQIAEDALREAQS